MNAAQRHRNAALLRSAGYEDCPALTMQSGDGAMPEGRELSFAWLAGTVLTGLTSVVLMGAALYVSFAGQNTFSTAYQALSVQTQEAGTQAAVMVKTGRVKPVAHPKSDYEIIEASIRDTTDGIARIRKQPFERVRATLATAATVLSEDIPAYDPVALLSRAQSEATAETDLVNTDIYGAEVEGEVAVRTAELPLTLIPATAITDQTAARFVRMTVEGAFPEGEMVALGYADGNEGLRELASLPNSMMGVAENVTVMPKTRFAEDGGLGRTERIVTLKEPSALEDALKKNGFTDGMVATVTSTLRNVYPSTQLPAGARLRVLFGPSGGSDTQVPYRMSIYIRDQHAATVALTDRGQYVLGLAPPAIAFPDEDTEEINVNNLPSIYRSIWETGRKHDLDDTTIERIVAMFAYDTDLTKKVAAGDSVEILQTPPDAEGRQELLYVGLMLGTVKKELYRFRTDEGTVDFYSPEGDTGRQFLQRRPLEGGGTLRSRFGYRKHPIFGSYKLHTGVDLAARTGTPIYAAGDGVIEMAQWYSGYGRYVEVKHVNGYETAYGHMSKIADGITPGTRVRQGQVIGYVGSTGYSTGPHLHYEIKINGNLVDPLSVKLPRDKSLPQQYSQEFDETVAQIRDLMTRERAPASPVTVASREN